MTTPIAKNWVALETRGLAEMADGLAARVTPGRVACGITTDSRTIVPGEAFIALRGQSHDGHAFLRAAIEAGAVTVVVERGCAPTDPRVDVVEVRDTLVAWGAIARAHLSEWRRRVPGGRIVAITGSAGKTTTKELALGLLRTVGPCHGTVGNLNNLVGLPSVVLGLDPTHRFGVFEMGMNVPGEIAALGSIAPPDVGLVVNIGLAHAGGVGGSIEDVAREKGALFEAVLPDGILVVNADDPAVCERGRSTLGRGRTTFGYVESADVRIVSRVSRGSNGSTTRIARRGRTSTFEVPIPGEAAVVDFAAALAASEAAAGPIADPAIVAALERVAPIDGRMRVHVTGDIVVLDDSYNANPASMRAALEALAEIPAKRRVAVLGEMKELGALAEREHERIGEAVVTAGVSLLISCGGMAEIIARAAGSRGVETALAENARAAARVVAARVKPGDAVLVKGSRSVGAERVVQAIVGPHGAD